MLQFARKTAACLLPLTFAAGLAAMPARADCTHDYAQAAGLVDAAQKSALAGNHPSIDEFSEAFQAAVDKLSAGRCMPELRRLIEHIQAQQEKYGVAPDNHVPAPLTD